MSGKTKKHQVAIYVTDNDDLTDITDLIRIAKSTANTISANPTTNSYDYIDAEKPETELDSYSYSMDHDIAAYKGNDDYEWAFEKFFYGDTGDDAKGVVVCVFMDHENPAGTYKAFASKATFSVSDADWVTGAVNINIAFNGDPVFGAVTSSSGTPVFTQAPDKPSIACSANSVTMACDTSGATIKYTDDGTDPTTSSTAQTYSEAITITEDTTFKAAAVSTTDNVYSRVVKLNAEYSA